ncbi:MAG TPA: hypothetical protein VFF26_08480 [Gallionella sp.]|nr:hypothetical protein [Gallionella sp.]
MKNYVLFLALLLSACSSDFWTVKSKAEPQPQPAVRQHPVPVEVQQPVRIDPVSPPQKKREHNIEED